MVRLFLDHNVVRETAHRLRAFGHDAVSAGELHRERAMDGAHLLEATQQGLPLANQAYLWTVSRGWVRAPLPASPPPPAPSP